MNSSKETSLLKKTRRAFSSIAIDQAHEQNNAAVKGDGGAAGLTQNSDDGGQLLVLNWQV